MNKTDDLKYQVNEALLACQEKKAEEVAILELEKGSGAFTDYFLVCSGTNPRQVEAIAEGVEDRLHGLGLRPAHTEGYKQAEWILLDYVDFVVHVFSEKARQYYDLERLWKSATRLEPADLTAKPQRVPAHKAASAKTAPAKTVPAKTAPRKTAARKAKPRKAASRKTVTRKATARKTTPHARKKKG
jgi:ribosome-associated protein